MKNTIFLVVVALALSVAIFVFFKAFYTAEVPEYGREIIAGFLGAVITVIITAVLLQAQSLSELRKEKSVGVFRAKLTCYSEFIQFLNGIIDDGIVDDAEQRMFRQWAMKVLLLSGNEVSDSLNNFFAQTQRYRKFSWSFLTQAEKDNFVRRYADENEEPCEIDEDGECNAFISIGKIVCELKRDLGEENVSRWLDAASAGYYIDKMLIQDGS